MPGPWDQYQTAPQPAQAGPWADYGAPALPQQPQAAPGPVGGAPRSPGAFAGFMANADRGVGFGDEMVAGLNTVGGVLQAAATGGPISMDRIGTRYTNEMAHQRDLENGYMAEHPFAANFARGTGGAALMPIGGPAFQGARGLNIARGALTGSASAAMFGLADKGTLEERLHAGLMGAVNPIALGLGAVGGALTPAIKAPVEQAAKTAQQILKDAGVALTPGQNAGGLLKNFEDLAMRAPILGTAIGGARDRGLASLNRAVGNRALESIGEVVPATVKAGHETVKYVGDRLGKLYDEAADLVPQVNLDQDFGAALASIGTHISELPTDIGKQFSSILANRLAPIEGKAVSGRDLRAVQSQISTMAAERMSSTDEAQRALGHMLEDVSTALKDQLGRASPEAGDLISKANQGWAAFVRLRAAGAKSNTNGIFTPGQLSTAVRTSDKSVGKGAMAKGEALMQDLSSAASKIMPDQFGNPGTANAMGLGALVVGARTAPGATAMTAGGLTAAATPYFLMARDIANRVPKNASQAEVRAVMGQLEELAQKDPAVRTLASKLAASAGLIAARETPEPMTLEITSSTNPEYLAWKAARDASRR